MFTGLKGYFTCPLGAMVQETSIYDLFEKSILSA